ncbi:hypothetical protein [Clostridium saccharoperbutylacetonicum]|uniref:hypothetical protein n=1 Tax=Clostridium saccharoperbutylacetonicum TaxID=36745 RepID=UPI0039ECE2D0
MKDLVITTTKEEFLLVGVKDDILITNIDGIMYFGEEAAVNYNNFISYRFIEVE